jgi:hypothetical protein
MVSVTGLIDKIYYRPDEILQIFDYNRGLSRFVSNARITMRVPHGDLKALDPDSDYEVEPRYVEFKTDSYGFRNDADYHQEKYLVVGDSFVLGTGNTQADILSSQLKRQYHIDTYNLSSPADMTGYARYLRHFKKTYGSNFKAFIFVFEGNDFPESHGVRKEKKPLPSRIGRYLKDLVKRSRDYITRTSLYRYTYSLYLKLLYSHKTTNQIIVRDIHGHKVGFLNKYADVTHRKQYGPNDNIEKFLSSIKDNIECIYFIPTKYRVYYDIDGDQNKPLPNAQWDYLSQLCQKLNIKCLNLTDDLIRESKRLLAEDNKFTWWKDDTHWNKYGINVAARAVAATVKAKGEKAP